MPNQMLLSIGYNEYATHFLIYGLDGHEIARVHVNDIANTNLHDLLDEQALEVIRRVFGYNDAP